MKFVESGLDSRLNIQYLDPVKKGPGSGQSKSPDPVKKSSPDPVKKKTVRIRNSAFALGRFTIILNIPIFSS